MSTRNFVTVFARLTAAVLCLAVTAGCGGELLRTGRGPVYLTIVEMLAHNGAKDEEESVLFSDVLTYVEQSVNGQQVKVPTVFSDTGVATLRHALGSMARLARAAGAEEVLAAATPIVRHRTSGTNEEARFRRFLDVLAGQDFGPNRGSVFSAHQMGSVRMGATPRDHACDPRGRLRRGGRGDAVVGGLYVGDGSLFPTGLGVNPMITIMAIARRVARTIVAET